MSLVSCVGVAQIVVSRKHKESEEEDPRLAQDCCKERRGALGPPPSIIVSLLFIDSDALRYKPLAGQATQIGSSRAAGCPPGVCEAG